MAVPEMKTDTKDALKMDQPCDFTIILGDSELAVHKAVLIATSHFFSAMIHGSMIESKMNKVKLQGLDAEVVRMLVEFAYTGDQDVVRNNTIQMLECASYLQMPAAIEACTKNLINSLSPNNCMEILSIFVKLSLESAVKAVKDYIKSNVTAIKEQRLMKLMPLEGIQVIVDYWDDTEMEAFRFVESWIIGDTSRNDHINDVMCRIRFPLMTRMDISIVKRNKLYKGSQAPWCELVHRAAVYHTLPMHLRVLDESLQTQVRADPTPVLFTPARDKDSVAYHSLDKNNNWRVHDMKAAKVPRFSDITVGVEVNNFYIVHTGFQYRQGWHIFDPRTQTWDKMANPRPCQLDFGQVVYHDMHLYAIGGWRTFVDRTCIRIERYSFMSDLWTPMPSMPVYVRGHAACVLRGTLYVCGGYGEDLEQDEEFEGDNLPLDEGFHNWVIEEHDFFLPSRLYSLDISSLTPKWTKLRSCPQRLKDHAMCILKVDNEEVVAVVEEGFDVCLYNPSTTHWSKGELNFVSSFYDYKVADGRTMLTKGRKFFFMNMFARPDSYEPRQSEPCPHGPQCALWTLTDDGKDAVQHDVEALPFKVTNFPDVRIEPFGAMLALPPNITRRRCSLNIEQTESSSD